MKLTALLLLMPTLAAAQSWRLLPDGYVVGVHVTELREAYALRLTQDDRVRDFARQLAAARAVIAAQEERIGGLLQTAKAREGLQGRTEDELQAERTRAERAERKVAKRTPWARIGQGLAAAAAVGGIIKAAQEIQTLTR